MTARSKEREALKRLPGMRVVPPESADQRLSRVAFNTQKKKLYQLSYEYVTQLGRELSGRKSPWFRRTVDTHTHKAWEIRSWSPKQERQWVEPPPIYGTIVALYDLEKMEVTFTVTKPDA